MYALFVCDASGKPAERLDNICYMTAKETFYEEERFSYNEIEAGDEPTELAVCELDDYGKLLRDVEPLTDSRLAQLFQARNG